MSNELGKYCINVSILNIFLFERRFHFRKSKKISINYAPNIKTLGNLIFYEDPKKYMLEYNPCITCGACCAHFRASFHWSECADGYGEVPVELTEYLTPHRRVMKGTNQNNPRCVALEGEIGNCVSCVIHPVRSTVCRDFPYSYENGIPNERCDQARMAYGLSPLKPYDDKGNRAA